MPTLTLIRHATTASNEAGIFMGSLDVPCTEEGLLAASELGKTLANTRFTRHYCSPLARARSSAERIFPNASLIIEPLLRERGLGEWSGQPKEDIRREYPAAFFSTGKMNPYFTPPNGESLESLLRRVRSFLEILMSLGEEDHAVAVTHNGVIRVMRCLIELRSMDEIFRESEPYLTPRPYYLDNPNWMRVQEHFAKTFDSLSLLIPPIKADQ